MTIRSTWTTAPSTATSNGCARNSRWSTTTSIPSRRSMASAIATRKVEDKVSAGPDVSPFPAGRGKLRPVADAGGEADRVSALPIRRARFSGLTRRIIFFNAFALLVFVAGVLWVQNNRAGLVDERIAGIRDQALIVAGALAEYTADQERRIIDLGTAEPLLRQLIAPT